MLLSVKMRTSSYPNSLFGQAESDKILGEKGGALVGEIEEILQQGRTIAVVGLSPKANRPSHSVSQYMQSQGYRIIPVNPAAVEVLGEKCYPDLASIPEKVDIVNIFRRSEEVPPIVQEAIRIGATAVWMQEGVVHQGAAARAREAGLKVVMDLCILKEHRRLKED